MSQHREETQEAESADNLGQNYKSLLDQQAWQVDAEPPSAQALIEQGEALTSTPPPVLRIIEALLFIGGPPLTAVRACEAIRGLTPAQFTQAVDSLNSDYQAQGRPYTVVTHDHGYILALRPRYRSILDKLYGTIRETRLSTAAIDVLSLVAYRQPATKQEVDSIRGVESGGVLRQLLRHGLITIVQRGESARREVSYGTTERFLELFGLRSLDDLPRTQDLQQL
jgi:segregation and condensation protein B